MYEVTGKQASDINSIEDDRHLLIRISSKNFKYIHKILQRNEEEKKKKRNLYTIKKEHKDGKNIDLEILSVF